jgi:hypothetical protein
MPKAREKLAIRWQEPTTEARWQDARPPQEGPALEAAVRAALEGEGGDRRVLVTFRRDGTRWRVQADLGDERGPSADADPRSSLDLTRRAVEALRRAGIQAEPGFPADPNEPRLPVGPTE